jgi:hypothetical protein
VDSEQDVIEPSATAFYDIAYGKLHYSRDQAKEVMAPFVALENNITDWNLAIQRLEENLPASERYYTKQVKAQEGLNAPGDTSTA